MHLFVLVFTGFDGSSFQNILQFRWSHLALCVFLHAASIIQLSYLVLDDCNKADNDLKKQVTFIILHQDPSFGYAWV